MSHLNAMGFFMKDFKSLFLFGAVIGAAHVIATWVRVKRERFRLRTNIRSTLALTYLLVLGGLGYVLYRNFHDRVYSYETTIWKILKGLLTLGGASTSYSIIMTVGSSFFSSRPVAAVVDATVSEATAPTTATTAA
eukprot:jgi/Mesvir1/14055/Mv01342-RA.1